MENRIITLFLQRCFAVILMALGLTSVVSYATEIVPLTLQQMYDKSSHIVHGTIGRPESAWNQEHTLIFTTITVDVHKVIKGPALTELSFKQIGGSVDTITLAVDGHPVLEEGDEVVLFLHESHLKELRFHVSGMAQGCFNVLSDTTTGQRHVWCELYNPEVTKSLPSSSALPVAKYHGVGFTDFKDMLKKMGGSEDE